jgi:hypothetical protein
MDLSEARRLKQLADENGKLKKLLPDAMLDNAANAHGPFCDQPNSTQAAPNAARGPTACLMISQ